ncbi:MAG: cellulose synthase subunit BcsC-related outer membrane protein, partial [Campylobacterota bacterium]
VETTAVLAVTPEVEVADETEEIKEEEPQAVEAVAEPVAETVSLAAAAPTTEIEEVVSIEESLPVALAAVAVQAEVSKKAADVLTEETVATSAIVTPKTVPVQETEALKHEAEPEIVVTVVEPEAEKDLEAEAVTVVPVVETAAVLAVTTESVAVATVPAAENTTPAVATPIIETAKVVSMEESLPVVVEEKVDTSVLEQQRSETEELIPVETKEDVEAAAAVETTLALVATEEAEVTDKSEKTEQEKEPEAVVAVTVSAAEQVVTVEESLPVMKEEKLEAQEKTEVVEELEADVVPVVVEAEETVIAESSVLASAAVVQETAEIEKPETIEEEKEPKTVEAVIEQEPEKNLPVVKPIDDSREEKPKPRTQEDEKKAQKTYKNYGNKAAVVTPEAEEEEMLLHQRIGYFIRDRDGVDGLGRLQETKMLITLGAESEQSMYGVSLEMVQLESGKLKITDQPLYGTDGTVAVETPAKSASGLALSLDYRYEQKNFAVSGMIGMTPSAGNDISPVPLWDVAVEGNFDILKTYGRFVQRAVVDSLLSSVGNSDLYTQQVWGRVVKQGVEAGVRLGEEYKFAWNLGYYPVIKGKNTLENSEITTTVSAVKSVAIASIDRFDAGLLLAYDDYEFDSEHYTYGHGGYFSPQSYMRGELLFDMTQQFSDSILFDARASVGYTSYKNEAVEKYPFEAGIETYAADSSKFISAETAVFLGLALGDSAQMMTGAGYSNSTGTNEYFLSFAFHIYLQEHQMSRKDFMSIDRFANTSR